jgi:hypothetical protein
MSQMRKDRGQSASRRLEGFFRALDGVLLRRACDPLLGSAWAGEWVAVRQRPFSFEQRDLLRALRAANHACSVERLCVVNHAPHPHPSRRPGYESLEATGRNGTSQGEGQDGAVLSIATDQRGTCRESGVCIGAQATGNPSISKLSHLTAQWMQGRSPMPQRPLA